MVAGSGPRGGCAKVSFAWDRADLCGPPGTSGAERSEAGLGTTKEVLGFIDCLAFRLDFIGFPQDYNQEKETS